MSTFCSRFQPCRTAYSAVAAGTAEAWAWPQWPCGQCCKHTSRESRNEVADERRSNNDERRNQGDATNHSRRGTVLGTVRRSTGDEYLSEGDHSSACRRLFRVGGVDLQEPKSARRH